MAPRPIYELVLAALWDHASPREVEELALILCCLPPFLPFPVTFPLRGRAVFHHQLPVQMGAAPVQFDLPEGRIPALKAVAAQKELCLQSRAAAHPFPGQTVVEAVVPLLA